jgi:Ribbon-helix-helix protein, copG family.
MNKHKSFRLTDRQVEKLEDLAKATGRSQSSIVRIAIDRLWVRQSPQPEVLDDSQLQVVVDRVARKIAAV